MPEEETGGAPEAPKVDAFGMPSPVAEAQPAPPDPDAKVVVEAKADWKQGDPIEQHPVVVGLQAEIQKVKDDYGGNLSGQRDKIDKLQDKIDELTGKKKGEDAPAAEPLYKDIKRVADLTDDEQEAMTETEKKLFDEAADLKENLNKLHLEGASRAQETETRTVEQFKSTTQAIALELAGNDKTVANQIIEQFNKFAGNDKLTDEQLRTRLEESTKLVPNYKAPKEQPRIQGRPVKAGGDGEDPFGVQKFVDDASKSKSAAEYPL